MFLQFSYYFISHVDPNNKLVSNLTYLAFNSEVLLNLFIFCIFKHCLKRRKRPWCTVESAESTLTYVSCDCLQLKDNYEHICAKEHTRTTTHTNTHRPPVNISLHSEIYFACCCFTWTFDLHCAKPFYMQSLTVFLHSSAGGENNLSDMQHV